MIKIKGIEVSMEGSFGTLIKESARAVHMVAKAASEKFKDEGEQVDYNTVVEHVLEELAKLKQFDQSDEGTLIPEEMEIDFFDQLRDLRNKKGDDYGFIDYDTQRPEPDAGEKIIKSAIKDVFIDPRSDTLDIEDIKAIKKEKKKKKKKK
jgi:hypothetical protein